MVGARTATTVLRDGELVTVDGAQGTVTEGAVAPAAVCRRVVAAGAGGSGGPGALATKIYVNLAFADHAEEVAALPVDGVGLLRAEFMVTDALKGVHRASCSSAATRRRSSTTWPSRSCGSRGAFEPRPVVYRSIDFRSNEFSNLEGGDQFEPHEENPMIGYRGCYRYVREPDLFRLELDVLARVLEETPNIVLMIPFVRTAWELEACLDVVDASPVAGSLPVWVMAEVPSVAYWIPTYAGMGIEGVSIGSNDLTQLMLGVDRDSQICADVFDEADPAVLDAIGRIIGGCQSSASPRRCAARPRPTGRPSPSTSSPGHHVDIGQPRRRRGRAPDRGRRRVAAAAPGRRAGPTPVGGWRGAPAPHPPPSLIIPPRAPSRSRRRGIPARTGRTPCRSRSRSGSRAPRRPS